MNLHFHKASLVHEFIIYLFVNYARFNINLECLFVKSINAKVNKPQVKCWLRKKTPCFSLMLSE